MCSTDIILIPVFSINTIIVNDTNEYNGCAVVLANHCYGFWFPPLSVDNKAYRKCFVVAPKTIFTIIFSL